MFDIKALEAEARKEVDDELATAAKGKIKASLRAIAQARKVLANLESEHQALMRDVGSQ